MLFFEFTYTQELNFFINYLEKTNFKNTYYQIVIFNLSGNINNERDFNLLNYFVTQMMDYNAKSSSIILDFTNLIFNYKANFSLSEQYAIISNQENIVFQRIFFSKLEAINFFIKENIKKFPNSKYNDNSSLPEINIIKFDKELSKVDIKTFISQDEKLAYIKLIGIYPYKGRLEANYILNTIDFLPELKSIKYLIMDVTNFTLESDWDNDLSDLEPTNSKYKQIKIYYLISQDNEFMNNHHNLFFSLDEILAKIS